MPQEQKRNEQFKCEKCGQTFNSEREHREHQEKAHRGESTKTATQGR
jgi:uncharacterized C2H2 Zn-finger protein